MLFSVPPHALGDTEHSSVLAVIGEVVPRQGGDVAAAIAAPVDSVAVIAGMRVVGGGVLAELNIDDRRADLKTAQAQIAVAEAQLGVRRAALDLERANLKRLARLRGSAAFNASRFEDSQKEAIRLRAEIAVARAQIEEAKARAARLIVDIKRARIVAPYNAVVTSREIDVGDFVTPGRRMFTLVNVDALEVAADVPVSALHELASGAALDATTRDGEKLRVEVRSVIPVENPLTRTRSVRFGVIDAPQLAIGQSVEVILSNDAGG